MSGAHMRPPHPQSEGLATSLHCHPGCLPSRNVSFLPVVFGRVGGGAGEDPFPPRGQQVCPWAMPQGQTVATLSVFFPVLSIQDLVQGKTISYEKKGTCRKIQ